MIWGYPHDLGNLHKPTGIMKWIHQKILEKDCCVASEALYRAVSWVSQDSSGGRPQNISIDPPGDNPFSQLYI